ncbi:uncharacterized protein LOC131930239 [Physella acuta]|uniref:uncharacterized protein LOC131930239 n=1 Tax=Physella acuta TaxID=109671 RepID=UPI0027DD0E79|nr:uncharacterized protein LOC131930239 [Physella acuta]
MSRTPKFQTYDSTVGKDNARLKAIACKVVNSGVPTRYKINLRDEILSMKEKERLGFNFNRSLTASLRSRWDVVENATKSFLQEIVDMNDQIEDDSKKNERQLLGLIFTRSTNISLESRVEQLGGLFMRITFYKTVLEEKIKQYDHYKTFLVQCCELMGYLQPGQLLDRYAALNHVFKELYGEYDARATMMNKLQERLSDIRTETDHRNMLMHNEMSDLHMKLKILTIRINHLEYELSDRIDHSTGTEMEIYRIKNSIHRSYVALMNYRGLEPTDSDPYVQLEHIEARILACIDVIRFVKEETMKVGTQVKKSKREKELESVQLRIGTDSSSSDNEPGDANESHQMAQGTAGSQPQVRRSQPKVRKKSFLPPLDPSRTSMTGKVGATASKESSASVHSAKSMIKHVERRENRRVLKDKSENKSKIRSTNTRRPIKQPPREPASDTDTDTDDTMDKMDSKMKPLSISTTEFDKTMVEQVRRELEERLAQRLRNKARAGEDKIVHETTCPDVHEPTRAERIKMYDLIKRRKREIEDMLYTKPEILLQRCSQQEVKTIDWWRRSRLNQLHRQRSIFLEKPPLRECKSLKKPPAPLAKPRHPPSYTMSRKYIKLHYLDILANVDIRRRNSLQTEQLTLT